LSKSRNFDTNFHKTPNPTMELFLSSLRNKGGDSDSDSEGFERKGKIPVDTSDPRYLRTLSVRDLKDTLRQMGLKLSGTKEELIERVLKGEDGEKPTKKRKANSDKPKTPKKTEIR